MRVSSIGPTLIQQERIHTRVKELGREIEDFYKGRPVLALAVLKGAFHFVSDLIRAIDGPVEVAFITLSSYGAGTESTGKVRQLSSLDTDITDRDVLIVEDIIDTGHTLTHLLKSLGPRNPASLRTCTLLNKPSKRQVEVPIDHKGFDIPDVFVVGYGLDLAERYRNLPYIAEWVP
ncbi:MAG: hypoxanthine phosphoribosyltransferase [Gemmatimonadetes bacterium]|nr:hypoxanthine phosphoribosyltransferase [Gemmatimonadota bacterium]